MPRVFPELSSRRLITMEYCPGVKITDLDELQKRGFDLVQLAFTLTTSYLEQICRHGFFHCDPHPGNLCVNAQGQLVYYDCGMMNELQVT